MPDNLQTAEQDLASIGVIASYIWKPQRLFVRNPNPSLGGQYIPADVVSDGSSVDVAGAVRDEGRKQLNEINSVASSQKNAISRYERDYTMVRENLEESYRRMYNYFIDRGFIALATIMATAIVNLSLL